MDEQTEQSTRPARITLFNAIGTVQKPYHVCNWNHSLIDIHFVSYAIAYLVLDFKFL